MGTITGQMQIIENMDDLDGDDFIPTAPDDQNYDQERGRFKRPKSTNLTQNHNTFVNFYRNQLGAGRNKDEMNRTPLKSQIIDNRSIRGTIQEKMRKIEGLRSG